MTVLPSLHVLRLSSANNDYRQFFLLTPTEAAALHDQMQALPGRAAMDVAEVTAHVPTHDTAALFLGQLLDVLEESEHSSEALLLRRQAGRLDADTLAFYQSPHRAVGNAQAPQTSDDVIVTMTATFNGTPYTHEDGFQVPFSRKYDVEQFLHQIESALRPRHPDLTLTAQTPLSEVVAPRAALNVLGEALMGDSVTRPFGQGLQALAAAQPSSSEALRRRTAVVEPQRARSRRFP
jgi:hypothetical protein